jgi:NADH-quinone oxidoreductase subunit M
VDAPLLTLLVVVPLLGALAVAAVPRGRETLAKQLALGVSLLTLGLAIATALAFDLGGPQYQLTEQVPWIPQLGVSWSLGLTGISLALVCLTAVATPVVLGAMWHEADDSEYRVSTYYALVLALAGMTIGAFLATDVLLFYILFEAMLLPMYFVIGLYGGPRRQYAAVKFLLYNLLGGLLMLAAVIGLYLQAPAGERTFALADLVAVDIPEGTQTWLFLGFMIAFAIKAPLWPFHTWLPDAAAEAPPSQAAYLSGVVDKVGTFGMVALVLPLFPEATATFAPVLVGLAVVSILYGGLLAIGQADLKRLVAFTSISHFGVIVLGIFALTTQATTGSTFYMVTHGFSTAALFLAVGALIARGGSRQVADYGGVQKPAPVLAGFLLVAGLSGLALPGLGTFVSEILVLLGTFSRYQVAAVLATLGIILAALYILLMYQRTMTGPTTERTAGFQDLRGREVVVLAPLVALLLVLGVLPGPVLEVVEHGTVETLAEVGVTDPAPVLVAEGSTP